MLELQPNGPIKDRIILVDVSMQVGESQSLAIVGESGSLPTKGLAQLPERSWICSQYSWPRRGSVPAVLSLPLCGR